MKIDKIVQVLNLTFARSLIDNNLRKNARTGLFDQCFGIWQVPFAFSRKYQSNDSFQFFKQGASLVRLGIYVQKCTFKRTPSYLEEMELAVVDSEEGTFAFFVSVFYDEG